VEPVRVALHAVFAYLFLLVGTRLSGKRTLAQATVVEFVLALVIGDMVDDVLWAEVPVATFAVATATLFALDVLGDRLTARFPALSPAFGEAPVLVMADGVPVTRAQRRERLRRETMDALLRAKEVGPGCWDDVKELWIDGGGRPAVVPREEAQPLTRGAAGRRRVNGP
jgi:uncharacterized membrane protein YcaP (DUF421 family)